MKSYAKVNIFLKITGRQNNYHKLISRFMLIKNYFDEIEFIPSREDSFNIEGDFSCKTEHNLIYKAYIELLKYTNNLDIKEFFKYNKVSVIKLIAEGSGLGGGSSNASTFLKMINDNLNLGLSIEELVKVGSKVGADVPFFLYDIESANVSGIGEIVEEFNEEALDVNIITPKIYCNTKDVYQTFRKNFYKETSDMYDIAKFKNLKSSEVFEKFNIDEANDLYIPALALYPELKDYAKKDFLFSGSGSSFFKLI